MAANLQAIAGAKGIRVEEVTVVILNRPRNADKITAVRQAGAQVRLISDGDVAPALMAALPDTGIDAVMGIGGTPARRSDHRLRPARIGRRYSRPPGPPERGRTPTPGRSRYRCRP
ncbi:MAG: fructose-bisphosphatase class II [Chloroflexi bacterium]|nr:fructose-bisphosphatase class II [Chloroflexota bacterium]